jgi:Glycosyltransferase
MSGSKIAITMPRLGLYGGAEGFGWRLAKELAATGHSVDYLCARAEGPLPEGVIPVELGRPPLGRAVKNIWFAWAVEKHLRDTHYDLVIGLGRTWHQDILRVGGGPQDIFQRLTLAAYGCPSMRLVKHLRRIFSPSAAVIRWMERRQFDTPSNPRQHIICVSHLVRDWLLEAHPGLNPAQVGVIYNKPDLDRFAPPDPARRAAMRKSYNIAETDVAICTAGTNFALKGVGTLIEALALLPENFRLAVAGGRNPEHWLRQADHLGLGRRVSFLGKVLDMPSFYGISDVFALPTYYDACSNAVLEALACGLPAITSSRNGSARFVPERFVLKDPGDARTLAELIREAAAQKHRPPFVWPEDQPCGLEPYVALVDEMLAQKRSRP